MRANNPLHLNLVLARGVHYFGIAHDFLCLLTKVVIWSWVIVYHIITSDVGRSDRQMLSCKCMMRENDEWNHRAPKSRKMSHFRSSISCVNLIMIQVDQFAWQSKKQTTIALSSTEVEYIAGVEVAKERIWIKAKLEELKSIKVPTLELNCDNQSYINLSA